MARNPILSATLQAAALGAVSNVLAQGIRCWREDTPLEVDWIPVFQFLIFSIISTPPNFIWQEYLESAFPARAPPTPTSTPTPRPPLHPKKAAPADEQRPQHDQRPQQHQQHQQPLNVRNTLAKLALDQTLGAVLNTLLFSIYIRSIRMAMPAAPRITSFPRAVGYWVSPGAIDFSAVDLAVVLDAALAEFGPIMLAGLKLWPAVSLVNYSMVKTVQGRSLVGCVAGLGWGVYMSMMAAK
ncbi:hypothetical protein E4U41_004978 [Claviceps citrina]|nr:hypothetical protein E4U41_004978 [Claviceps citrina]